MNPATCAVAAFGGLAEPQEKGKPVGPCDRHAGRFLCIRTGSQRASAFPMF